VIDSDALRQFASDLDAKTDACYLDARHAADLGDEGGAIYHESKGIAYADMADRIRKILADDTTEQQEAP
jgi:hypothetical protein